MAAENAGARYTACLQCTQHCYQAHGQGLLPCSRIPSFFSFLTSSPSSAPLTLPIPPAFLGGRNVRIDQTSAPGESLHSEAQLEGPSGEVWPVVLEGQTLTDLAFTTGWAKFVNDHRLGAGDLLLFKLLSRGSFSVSIYGRDGCEKADALTARNSESRLVANAQSSKKRPAVDNIFDCVCVDANAKRRKVVADQQRAPLIIDLEDEEDKENDVIVVSKLESGKANQNVQLNGNDVIDLSELESSNNLSETLVIGEEHTTDCITDTNEDTGGHPNMLEHPPTPSNADKSNLPIKTVTEKNLQSNLSPIISNCEKLNSFTEESTSEAEDTSSEDEEEDEKHQHYTAHVEKASQSHVEDTAGMDSLPCSDETLQHDRLQAVLDKDYITEAFISKRRTVSAEERHNALLAAKQFKSSHPHMRKLMKESHVYRGFWLSFPSDFSSEYLPSEIQQATLLDSLGRAWFARWLGKRNGLSGGWRKFSLDHGLEEGDVCVFELIDRKKLVIKVHIFRVVELIDALPGRNHYARKPSSRPLIGYNCRKSSPSLKKMRGAIADRSLHMSMDVSAGGKYKSKNPCNFAEDILNTPPKSREAVPDNLRLKNPGMAVAKQLDPLPARSESGLRPSALKLATTSTPRDPAPDILRLKDPGKAVAKILDPLPNRTESGLPPPALKLVTSNSREQVPDSLGLKDLGKAVTKKLDPLPNGTESGLPLKLATSTSRYPVPSNSRLKNLESGLLLSSASKLATSTSRDRLPRLKRFGKASAKQLALQLSRESGLPPSALNLATSTPRGSEPDNLNLKLKTLGKAVAKQLETPLPNRSESRLPLSASMLTTINSKEHTDVSETKACRKYYTVERLFNRRKGNVEEEFLVELEIEETLTSSSSRVKRDGNAWWVPLSHFTKDKMSCHL